jgi:hypothetical protein
MTEDQKHAGGIYLWKSRARAEAWFNTDWTTYMTETWGQAPLVEYLDCPIVFDNETKHTVSRVAA